MKPTALLSLLAFAWAVPAHAGGVATGKVSSLNVFPGPYSVAMVTVASAVAGIPGTPACNTIKAFALSLADGAGRTLVNQLLHAQMLGYAVTIYGDGTCSVWADRETVLYVSIAYP